MIPAHGGKVVAWIGAGTGWTAAVPVGVFSPVESYQ